MDRELAIGLIFLGLLGVISALGIGTAWLIQHRRPALSIEAPAEPSKPLAWLGQDLQDLDTNVIERGTVTKVVGRVGGLDIGVRRQLLR